MHGRSEGRVGSLTLLRGGEWAAVLATPIFVFARSVVARALAVSLQCTTATCCVSCPAFGMRMACREREECMSDRIVGSISFTSGAACRGSLVVAGLQDQVPPGAPYHPTCPQGVPSDVHGQPTDDVLLLSVRARSVVCVVVVVEACRRLGILNKSQPRLE